jgi:CubicO group peptidase (beta-lactamase class C family)
MQNQLNIVLKTACEKGLAEGVYTGVSAAISVVKEKVRYQGWFSGGVTRSDQSGMPVERSTLFDLASLTKPLCTTLCTLSLITAGKIRWKDNALSLFDFKIPQNKTKISIENLLYHASGLPAYKPYFLEFKPQPSRENIFPLVHKILNEPLLYSPGAICLYSDLGFILLGALIEHIEKVSLDEFYRKNIIDPMQLSENILFLPIKKVLSEKKEAITATENCPWRQRVLQGEVHDEHCWLMGGVAGHAGLFGTAVGVLHLCERLLDCWHDRAHHPAFSSELLRYALNWKKGDESWHLGFDSPSPGQSSSGQYFSSQSAGHLGFTGTSFWMDPTRSIVVVLLTNRVHPSRENTKIKAFRPLFHDYIMEKICGTS